MQTKLTFLFFFFFSCNAIAQHIPDANFAAAIRAQCATCIDANDDLTGAAASLTDLNVSGKNISNLSGIDGFIGINYLNCNNNQLISLPSLPNNLMTLFCDNNQLISLSDLPNSLVYLYCNNNQLTSLPALPNSLTTLYCGQNLLTNLFALPNNLITLSCSNNRLTSLPDWPNSLSGLDCKGNPLTNLPDLPNSLSGLDCSSIGLTNLPALPNSLQSLKCDYNQLTSLPALPNNLTYLNCDYNQLTNLPVLPNSLTYLSCKNNQLISLMSIPPFLHTLWLDSNPNLSCIGVIPNTLTTYLNLNSTALTCLPNIPPNITIAPTFPICDSTTNTNGCFIPPIVSGRVVYDANDNGIADVGDRGIGNTLVSDVAGSQRKFIAVTDAAGYYTAAADTCSNGWRRTTAIGIPQRNANAFVRFPILRSFDTGDTSYQKITNQDFLYRRTTQADDSVQVHIHTQDLVIGDTSYVYVWYENLGNTVLNGDVTTRVSDTLLYLGGSQLRLNPNAPFVTNGVQNFSYSNLQPFQSQLIRLKVYTPPLIPNANISTLNKQVKNATRVNGNGGGGGTSDDDIATTTIKGSHDPNDKQCNITELTPAEVIDGKPIEYTINFENTGTWHAKWVVIEDTLSEHLDYRTLRTLVTSHPRFRMKMEFDTTSLAHKVIVKWVFPNIGLKYKTLSPLEAQGFVKFSIQAKPTAPLGAVIKNTAYIYFDVNPAIITNTVALNVQHPLPVEWLSFAAKAGSNTAIDLDWQTASETNNSHFVVERSTDAIYFMPFGKIKAKNSIIGGAYAYTDVAVQPNTLYYYRIKQIDFDGKASYSNTVTVKITSKYGGLTLSPNPATAETLLTWDKPIEQAILQVLTSKGELVNSLSIPQGSTRFALKLDGLASGVYFISVKSKENAWYEKLVVQ